MQFLSDAVLLARAYAGSWVPWPMPPDIVHADVPVSHVFPVPVVTPPAKRTRKPPMKPFGLGEMKADLLDQLERYEHYIERLRVSDPNAYKQYRRVGAYCLPSGMSADAVDLEPGFLDAMPAFGAVAFLSKEHESEKFVSARFVYFMKLSSPGHAVERISGGSVYSFTVYWDDTGDKKIAREKTGVARTYMMAVLPDGSVRPLRVLLEESQTIKHKKGDYKGRTTTLRRQRWGLPEVAFDEDNTETAPSEKLKRLFRVCANFWLFSARGEMIRIVAIKGRVAMPFSVNPAHAPEFFADRDHIITQAGVKKRIFHMVRTHLRANGSAVKMHFRGLRDFSWNGYRISISVPGMSHSDLAEFAEGAVVVEANTDDVGTIDTTDAADFLATAAGVPLLPEARC